jgi:aspartyl-tRNA(Asn)/glutamyl-tRNA(Gln) amidotransferase subunit A
MSDELCFLTVAEAAAKIASKKLSPVELLEAYLSRIEAVGPQLDAFITLTAERALDQARAAEAEIARGNYRGPLHGIPFGLKDIYETKGILTTGHSKVMQDHVPGRDATTTARLYDAGMVLLGKLATHEFAHGGPSFDLPWPPARNPWAPDHVTGGSSSGSGAAVAAGLLPVALGSDTGGSIRNPACLCGTAGLKPTYGLVSRAGVIANSYTFDHCGPLTWTVEDAALVMQALAGHDPRDPASASVPVPDFRAALGGDLKGKRVGIVRHFYEEDVPTNDEMRKALEAAYDVLRGLGAILEDVRLRPMQEYNDIKVTIAESELYSVHEANLRTRPGDFGSDFLGRCLPACLISAADYFQAQRERRVMLAEFASMWERFDLLVTAGTYGPAPRFDGHRTVSFWEKPAIATPFSVAAGPALAVNIGFGASGLPLSMQIAGRPFDDAAVLQAGDAYERATPWRRKRPSLTPGAAVKPPPHPAPDAPSGADTATCERVAQAVAAAGLTLNERQIDQVRAAAPYVAAMVGRINRDRPFSDEPSTTFGPDR